MRRTTVALAWFGLLFAHPVAANTFFQVIERPIARYLLCETAEGKAIVERVLGFSAAANRDARAMRRFADAMENEARWAGFGGELQERLARGAENLRNLRGDARSAGPRGGKQASDAVGALQRFARTELRLAEAAGGGAEEVRFVATPEDSYSTLRTEFLDDIEVGMGGHANFILARRIDTVGNAVLALELSSQPAASRVWNTLEGLRTISLETAVQWEGARASYAGHRSSVLSLARRLARQAGRISSETGAGVHDIRVASVRKRFLDEIEEIKGWLPAPPAR